MYPLPNITAITLRNIRWNGQVAGMGQDRNQRGFRFENRKDNLEDPHSHTKTGLKETQ